MGKITREQIQKINNKCMNDWKLDVEYYIYHKEKTLVKQIKIDDENYLEFALRYNYKNQISLHISKFFHEQGKYYATSNGLGKSKILDNTKVKRKNINDLIEYTKQLNDSELLEINKNTQVTRSSIFVESEEF